MRERIIYVILGTSTLLNILLIFSCFFYENNVCTGRELVLRKDVREVSLDKLQKFKDNVFVMDENILFLGDSITHRYDLDRYYSNYRVVNSGKEGNRTKDILEDMENRVYIYNPSKIFLLIGINQMEYDGEEEIYNGIVEIIDKMKKNRGAAEIYVESIYPINNTINGPASDKDNNKIIRINGMIEEYAKYHNVYYIDVYSKLVDTTGKLNREYTEDGLHLNNRGYDKVTEVLEKYIKEC